MQSSFTFRPEYALVYRHIDVHVFGCPFQASMNFRSTAYLRQQQEKQVEALKAAKTRLMGHGFSERRVHCIFQPVKRDIALDIIHLWKTEDFDMVVLNRNPGNSVNFFTRSISNLYLWSIPGKRPWKSWPPKA